MYLKVTIYSLNSTKIW